MEKLIYCLEYLICLICMNISSEGMIYTQTLHNKIGLCIKVLLWELIHFSLLKSSVNWTNFMRKGINHLLKFDNSSFIKVPSGGSRITPRWGCQSSGMGRGQHIILPNFPKKCMKLKEFEPREEASPVPPIRSTNGSYLCVYINQSAMT